MSESRLSAASGFIEAIELPAVVNEGFESVADTTVNFDELKNEATAITKGAGLNI